MQMLTLANIKLHSVRKKKKNAFFFYLCMQSYSKPVCGFLKKMNVLKLQKNYFVLEKKDTS